MQFTPKIDMVLELHEQAMLCGVLMYALGMKDTLSAHEVGLAETILAKSGIEVVYSEEDNSEEEVFH